MKTYSGQETILTLANSADNQVIPLPKNATLKVVEVVAVTLNTPSIWIEVTLGNRNNGLAFDVPTNQGSHWISNAGSQVGLHFHFVGSIPPHSNEGGNLNVFWNNEIGADAIIRVAYLVEVNES